MIENAHGNLLHAQVDALVNTVNTEGVMGKGIALQFKAAFPGMYHEYEDACRRHHVQLGKMHVHDRGGIADGPRWIINFPTKGHWRARSRVGDIESGLNDLVQIIERLNIRSIAIPPLGCGNGGLDWADVRPRIEKALAPLSNVDVLLYGPTGAPPANEMPNRSVKPKLTIASATLLVLMHRYLQGLLDPFVTQLEVQKLMYFMQEAGQPLKLNYKAHIYGPYAPNLGHVLKRLDSHYIRGVGDGGNEPDKPLEPVSEAVMEAYDWLARDDETNRRMDRVVNLIEGFEDPYGMEMLSTMLWIMVHDERTRDSPSLAIECVHAWSPRKRDLLKVSHLEKAWQRLKDQDWHLTAHSIAVAH